MPMTLKGACRCGAVAFTCDSHTPQPYQRCYCTICRKTAGGGGYAINLLALHDTLRVEDPDGARGVYRADIVEDDGVCSISSAERIFCTRCATALWLWDPTWPTLVHPFASALDTALPVPVSSVHLMLDFKPAWVEPQVGPDDECFPRYPELSIEDWHKRHKVWVD